MGDSRNFKAAIQAIKDCLSDEPREALLMQEVSQAGNAEQKRELLSRWLKAISPDFNADDITCEKQLTSISAWVLGYLHKTCSRGGEVMAKNTPTGGSSDRVKVPVSVPSEMLRKLMQTLKSSIDSAAQAFAVSSNQLAALQRTHNDALAQQVKDLTTKLSQEAQRYSQEIDDLRKKVEEAETKLDDHINNQSSNTPNPPLAKSKAERWLMPALIGAAIIFLLLSLWWILTVWFDSKSASSAPSSNQPAASTPSIGRQGESLEEWTREQWRKNSLPSKD